MAESINWDELDQENPLKQVRAHVKALEKELDELREFKVTATAEGRKRAALDAFKGIGLSEKQADLYLKVNPEGEISVDNVKLFAEEYGFKAANEAAESETSEEEGDESGAFAPVSSTDGTPPSGKVYNSSEWFDLYMKNPAEALAIAKKGKVQLQADPSNDLRIVGAATS